VELGELFDRGFRIWKENVKVGVLFLSGSIFSWIPIILFAVYLLSIIGIEAVWMAIESHNGEEVLSALKIYAIPIVSVLIVAFMVSGIIYLFFELAAFRACSLAIDGRMGLGEAMSFAKRRLLTMISAEVLKTLIIVAPFALTILGFLSPVLAFIVWPAAAIASIVLAILLVYVPYAVAEGYGAVESVKASYSVARRGFMETIVIIVVVFLINMACNMVGELSFYMYGPGFYYSHSLQLLLLPVGLTALISIVLSCFIARPLGAMFYLLYFRSNVNNVENETSELL